MTAEETISESALFDQIEQHVAGGIPHTVPAWGDAKLRLRMLDTPQWLAIRVLNPFFHKPEEEANVDALPFGAREATIKKMQAYRAAIVAASAIDPATGKLAFLGAKRRTWLEAQPIGVLDPIAEAVLVHSKILAPRPEEQVEAAGADPTASQGSISKRSPKGKASSGSGSTA